LLSPKSIMTCKLIAELNTPSTDPTAGIVIASSRGDLETVEQLASRLSEANIPLPTQSMLLVALERRHDTIVSLCLQAGGIELNDDLHQAAWDGLTPETLQLLLDSSLDIFQLSTHLEYLNNLLFDAVELFMRMGRWPSWPSWPNDARVERLVGRLAKFFLANGAQIDDDLVLQAAGYCPTSFMALLLAHGTGLQQTGALHLAAGLGRVEMVSYLLENGAEVNDFLPLDFIGDYREPPLDLGYPLHHSAYGGKIDAVRVLIEKGADPGLRTAGGRDALRVLKESPEADNRARQEIEQILERATNERLLLGGSSG
jgi:hypothetical protein